MYKDEVFPGGNSRRGSWSMTVSTRICRVAPRSSRSINFLRSSSRSALSDLVWDAVSADSNLVISKGRHQKLFLGRESTPKHSKTSQRYVLGKQLCRHALSSWPVHMCKESHCRCSLSSWRGWCSWIVTARTGEKIKPLCISPRVFLDKKKSTGNMLDKHPWLMVRPSTPRKVRLQRIMRAFPTPSKRIHVSRHSLCPGHGQLYITYLLDVVKNIFTFSI